MAHVRTVRAVSAVLADVGRPPGLRQGVRVAYVEAAAVWPHVVAQASAVRPSACGWKGDEGGEMKPQGGRLQTLALDGGAK